MTFEEIRREALRKVADGEDWLRSDWSDEPSRAQVLCLRAAGHHLAEAHKALDNMARLQTRDRQAPR
jgi:hypothetical protein